MDTHWGEACWVCSFVKGKQNYSFINCIKLIVKKTPTSNSHMQLRILKYLKLLSIESSSLKHAGFCDLGNQIKSILTVLYLCRVSEKWCFNQKENFQRNTEDKKSDRQYFTQAIVLCISTHLQCCQLVCLCHRGENIRPSWLSDGITPHFNNLSDRKWFHM